MAVQTAYTDARLDSRLPRFPALQGSPRGLDPGALLARVINSVAANPPPVRQSTLLAAF